MLKKRKEIFKHIQNRRDTAECWVMQENSLFFIYYVVYKLLEDKISVSPNIKKMINTYRYGLLLALIRSLHGVHCIILLCHIKYSII